MVTFIITYYERVGDWDFNALDDLQEVSAAVMSHPAVYRTSLQELPDLQGHAPRSLPVTALL